MNWFVSQIGKYTDLVPWCWNCVDFALQYRFIHDMSQILFLFSRPLMRWRCNRKWRPLVKQLVNPETLEQNDSDCVCVWCVCVCLWVMCMRLYLIARAIPCGIAYIKINDYSLWIIYIILWCMRRNGLPDWIGETETAKRHTFLFWFILNGFVMFVFILLVCEQNDMCLKCATE